MTRAPRSKAAKVWPDCGCDDGTDPDEPSDRGFICPHDPRGVQEPRDDTAYIQEMRNRGEPLPPGTYKIRGTINLKGEK